MPKQKYGWTSTIRKGRSKKRGKRKKLAKLKIKTLSLMGFIFFIFLVLGNLPLSPSINYKPDLPVSSSVDSVDENRTLSFYLYKSILGSQLPGMRVDYPKEHNPSMMAYRLSLQLLGVDLKDPASILAMELTGWAPSSIPIQADPPSSELDKEPPVTSPVEEEPSDEPSEDPEDEKLSPEEVAEQSGEKILIYHTHITESFVPDAGEPFTDDLEITVAYLGEKLAKKLEENHGIMTLHNQEVFDQPRRYSYSKARPTIKDIIENNPEIGMVVDFHRDGISRDLTTAEIDGQKMGKVMFIVGSQHEEWGNNYNFALKLKQSIEDIEPAISRGVRKQPFTYNQDLHPHSVLVELGGHENSFDEVKRSLPILAEALAKTYRDLYYQ